MSNQKEKIDNELLDAFSQTAAKAPVNGSNRILNDSSVFYKGLFGMILCILPGAIIGLVLIKVSLEQAKEGLTTYHNNPQEYKLSSYELMKKGRMLARIGLAIFIIEIVALVAFMSVN